MNDKPDGRRWAWIVMESAFALLVLYMAMYYVLVCPAIYEGLLPHPRTVEYRCGRSADKVFTPAQWIDAVMIRREYWAELF